MKIAQRFNGNKSKILESANLNSSDLTKSTEIITLDEERRLWQAIRSDTGRVDIGLKCGLDFKVQTMGQIGYMMMSAPSIQSAIKNFEKYQELVGDSMGLRIEQGFDYTRVYVDLWSSWNEELRFTMDMFMAAIFSWIKNNTIHQSCPFHVGFNFAKPQNIDDYKQIFSPAKISFGCKVSHLTYKSSSIKAPVISANEKFFNYFQDQLKIEYDSYLNKDTVTYKVQQLVRSHICDGTPDIKDVAQELHIGVRSLQRFLKNEATSFQEILNEVRKEKAINYLERGELSISEIAHRIGYSEISTFSRKFKKWTGLSPSSYYKS